MSPIVRQAACDGTTGPYGCGPGWIRSCRADGRCRCVRCWSQSP